MCVCWGGELTKAHWTEEQSRGVDAVARVPLPGIEACRIPPVAAGAVHGLDKIAISVPVGSEGALSGCGLQGTCR